MVYQAENVPIPIGRKSEGLTASIRALKIGESFLIPTEDLKSATQKGLYVLAERVGYKITTRKVEGGLRVWRIGWTDASTKTVVKKMPKVEHISVDGANREEEIAVEQPTDEKLSNDLTYELD